MSDETITLRLSEATDEQLEVALRDARKGEQARRDLGSFWQNWERRRQRIEAILDRRSGSQEDCERCEGIGAIPTVGWPGVGMEPCPAGCDDGKKPAPPEQGERDQLLDALESARQWAIAPGFMNGPSLSESEIASGGVKVLSLDDFNVALEVAFPTEQPERKDETDADYALAARLERAALGWEADANLYFGRRRKARLAHAKRLWDRCWEVMADA